MKWSPSEQQFVADYPQAEDVAAAIDTMPLATGLLWTHVSGRAGVHRPLADVLFLECQPEVSDIRLATGVQQDVARLDVPVDESLAVSIVQRLGNRRYQFPRLLKQRLLAVDLLRQRTALDVL